MESGGNCVVVMGRRRDGEERFAACVVRADTRADVNNLVKRILDVRKCRASCRMERATTEGSGMEYGGITPLRSARALAGASSTLPCSSSRWGR